MRTDCGIRWGPTPWLLGAEIFPLRARAKGMALSTVSNWASNFVIAFITPPLFDAISGGYYFVLLGFCIVSGIVVFFAYPETAHATLEQLSQVFGDTTALDPEKLEAVVPQLPSEQIRSTTTSKEADTDKLLLGTQDGSGESRASSSTALEGIPVGIPTHEKL